MEQQQGSAIATFCCYAHEDAKLLHELKSHLSPLRKRTKMNMWDDGDINAGTEWAPEIKKRLNDAQIILLLISADFIDSKYCYGTEMQHALERHERGEAKVVPILLRPVSGWEEVSSGNIQLGDLQALPKDAKPVTSWKNRDEAWEDVAKGIRKVINELQGISPPSLSSQEQVNQSAPKPAPVSGSPGQDTVNTSSFPPTIQRPRAKIILLIGITISILIGGLLFIIDQHRESVLDSYIQEMKGLGLQKSKPDDKVRAYARWETLNTLQQLDGARKERVIIFLLDARLITNTATHGAPTTFVIDLAHADLSGINLSSDDNNLAGVVLHDVNLHGAHLKDTLIAGAILYNSDLSDADLSQANLNQTNLEGAHLSNATLEGACLKNADLSGADLSDTDLTGANLTGAIITQHQVNQATTCKGTITSNGITHSQNVCPPPKSPQGNPCGTG